MDVGLVALVYNIPMICGVSGDVIVFLKVSVFVVVVV